MAESNRVPIPSASGLGGVADIIQLLGGQKTSTKSGADTGALVTLLQQLQGQDFTAQLQSIFQQAGGQIPGLQAAYGNAVGARSGGNSSVQTALNKLLTDVTLRGQQQIAQLQQGNQQIQANVAGNIAGATKTSQTQQGTNLGRAGGSLLALQLVSQLAKSDLLKKITGGLGGAGAGASIAAGDYSMDPVDYSFGGMGLGSSGSGFSLPDAPSGGFGDYGLGTADFGLNDSGSLALGDTGGEVNFFDDLGSTVASWFD